jgi:hypothetical protein
MPSLQPQPLRARFESHPRTIQDLIHLYVNGGLNLEPGFQRASVWKDRDRVKLIESILRGYPLPAVFLYKRSDGGSLRYDVIDGKQRLESVLMYTGRIRGNRFSAPLSLEGESKPSDVDWTQLRRLGLQDRIEGYRIPTVEVEGELSDIIQVFVLINSTGKALSAQERRHARYCNSRFLQRAERLARRREQYFRAHRILSGGQIDRMKHIELVCELMVSANAEDVVNKKAALDKVMESNSLSNSAVAKAEECVVRSLNRVASNFPNLRETRLCKLADFYSLVVLFQEFEREGFILTDRRRNAQAQTLLVAFSNGVDAVSLKRKKLSTIQPGEELYRQYLLTVLEGSDAIANRRERAKILRGLLGSLFERKDAKRTFSEEQRRILWNTTAVQRCKVCHEPLKNFTIDHVHPFSRGGKTELRNAGLLCRTHNSSKGSRRSA